MTDSEFEVLKQTVRRLLGIDLDAYKRSQMRRRIEAFVQHSTPGHPGAFCRALERDRSLRAAFGDMLTINVTEFFRDPVPFAALRHTILPSLLAESPSLKVWSAGCSKGAEAYTVAMLLDVLCPSARHTILATDIDDRVLAVGRHGGPYTAAEVKNVPRALLTRYFIPAEGGYRLVPEIRARVRFSAHNLLVNAFGAGYDLILCRNVMIYFTDDARRALTRRFHDALRAGGVFLVGGSEAILASDALGFARIGPSTYRKPPSQAPVEVRLPAGTALEGR